jgi:hypothetical protein
VLGQAEPVERVRDVARAPVEVRHDVAVEPSLAPPSLDGGSRERDVRKVVRQVDEEGPPAVELDEADRLVGVERRERRLVHGAMSLLWSTPNQWSKPRSRGREGAWSPRCHFPMAAVA